MLGLAVHCAGEGYRERRALAGSALHLDVATHCAGKIPADREAEAHSAGRRVRARGQLHEGLEDQLLLVVGDARARVADADDYRAWIAVHPDADGPARR